MARQIGGAARRAVARSRRVPSLEHVHHGEREWARFVGSAATNWAAAFPDLRPRLERLDNDARRVPPEPEPALLHGDFHPAQFLVEGGRPRLIDFDNVCFGDPMYDLARFASHLFYKGMLYGRPLREIETAVAGVPVGVHRRRVALRAASNWFWHLAVSLVAKRAHRVMTRLESGAEGRVAQSRHHRRAERRLDRAR